MNDMKTTGNGHLLIIGGSEDRAEGKEILARFIALAGGAHARIIVIMAASEIPEEIWHTYDKAFEALGVRDRAPMPLSSRAAADDADNVRRIRQATGIFMSGGDQKRLLGLIGDSAIAAAMQDAVFRHGACVAGTSAGASAMSAHMLAEGSTDLVPRKGEVELGVGLGLIHHAVIDQHFSERHRLARLLSVVATRPALFGVGIDEDTALVITVGEGIEVIGKGSVTLIDGRNTISNVADAARKESISLIDVRLHMLPSGSRYGRLDADAAADDARLPAPLRDVIEVLMQGDASARLG